MKNEIEFFLQDLTYGSTYEFLEEGKHKDELTVIAKKRGIQLPCKDLAPFRCVYAYVDRFNKNSCRLKKEEVEKALNSLAGKAINFDHMRKSVIGHWIDAKIEGNKVIGYGIFFKGNFPEEYIHVKNLMEKGKLKVSFESWGSKSFGKDGKYDLNDIEFAGGGLLISTEPAFPGSKVTEFANEHEEELVLEFAKVMTPPKEFVHLASYQCECIECGHKMTTEGHCRDEKCPKCGGQMRRADRPGPGQGNEELEESRYYVHEMEIIMKSLSEVDCLTCKEKGVFEILAVDFEKNSTRIKCWNCQAVMQVDLTPTAKLTKKGKKIKKMSNVAEKANIEDYDKFIKEFEGSDEALEILLEDSMNNSKSVKYEQRQELQDNMFAIVKPFKTESGKERKIRMFPIHDYDRVRVALAKLAQDKPKQTLQKLDISVETVKNKILRRARQLKMKKLIEKYEKSSIDEVLQEIAKASLKRELSKDEVEKAKVKVDEKGEEITEDEAKAIVAEFKKEDKKLDEDAKKKDEMIQAKEKEVKDLTEKLEKATKKAEELQTKMNEIEKAKVQELVKARRDELGDYVKDLSDEQILDETKYEIAKLKKENAELRSGKKKDPDDGDPDFTKGSIDKDKVDHEAKLRDKIDSYAFPREKKDKD